ncbi:hypothetical protein KZP23_21685 [Echinicola marina]|uniref:DUF7151 family protein n=1 Tax=Echinicola marina TaxID=2859768 RepID=UPI001CF69DB4|nr:hypothetical protein [Echinicola marina]UCS93229.1 hypothetical protein KZP23_21685 [Echinicola marina]
MNYCIKSIGTPCILSLFLFSCEGEIGPNGLSSLTNITDEKAGTNCETGGLKIETGLDSDSNGLLDQNEVLNVNYVCNGSNGLSSLTRFSPELPGSNCENGGIVISSGIDLNKDGVLGDEEVTTSSFVCNGINGQNGLINSTSEPPSEICKFGGIKINSGIDTNGDNILDETEITSSALVCNGNDGKNSLSKVNIVPKGERCENGGLKFSSGIDSNNNGVLDEIEIESTSYTCNGLDGNLSLINISDQSKGDKCENGGIKIESGIDINNNYQLDQSEILVTKYVCHGSSGIINEEIQIKLSNGIGTAMNTSSSTPTLVPLTTYLDLNNYPNVDSVVFVSDPWVAETNNYASLELYNITDAEIVTESMIRSNKLYSGRTQIKTGNIFTHIPQKSIQLGLRFRSEIDGSYAASGIPYLYLYRKK